MNNDIITFYLAGPIWNNDNYKSRLKWREELIEGLVKYNCQGIDPTKKTHQKFKSESVEDVVKYRTTYGYNSLETLEFVDWIFYEDLKLIDQSNAIIAYVSKEIPSFGTAQELFYNYFTLKKKNFVITNMDLFNDSSVFLQKTVEKFYPSVKELITDIEKIKKII